MSDQPSHSDQSAQPTHPTQPVKPPVSDDDPLLTAPTTPVTNETIRTQLAHRTIRAFTDEPVGKDIMDTLIDVARRSPTSSFYQQMTIIRVTNEDTRNALARNAGQPYIGGTKGELVIFVADLHRNAVIRERAGQPTDPASTINAYQQAGRDTLIAAQNYVIAAESLGLGTVYPGSIGAKPQETIDLLGLPAHTYPVVGVLVGHPAQEPQFKPRLPRELTVGVDVYPDLDSDQARAALDDYDALVTRYYDMRNLNSRVDSFSNQIISKYGTSPSETAPAMQVMNDQGLIQR